MPLPLGTHVGPYEILAPLGAGGMGEVYRAKDTNLKREVALKVLPEAFGGDLERMVRFQREAEVLATLNHPNIAAIYGLEKGALIMELVEGETLSIPLPIDTALRYARQIAEALEYAHEHGVIHRDLKPDNVKVTSEGAVKLLDFGLAKAIESPTDSVDDPANSPTLTLGVTKVGVIMGTAAYISPEQAGGKMADRRADIWSFGVVLYEMLAGKRAFPGESASDTLASVLKLDPDWNALPASTPASIRKLVRQCLTKDRKQRLQAIGDARIAIEEVLAALDDKDGNESSPPARSRRGILPWMATAGALAIVAAIGWWVAWQSSRPVYRPLLRLNVDLGSDAIAGARITAVISPDGTRLIFPFRGPDGKQQLATRLLDQPQTTMLSGTEGAANPFFSPDGEWIGFFAERKLKKVSVRGGAVFTLCDAPGGRGAAWGKDGNIIATLDSVPTTGLSRIPDTGGTPQEITHPGETGEATHRWPQILPGGQAVLFMGNKTASNYDDANIEVLSLKTGQVKVVQRGGYFPRYLPGGYLVFVHHGTLFGVGFDLDRLEVRGTPALLLEDVAGDPGTGSAQFDFSRNGTFVYTSRKSSSGSWALAWLDSTGKTEPLIATPGIYYDPRLSPEGKRLAFSTNTDIEVYDSGRDTTTQLSFTGQTKTNLNPVWTPDGKHIVFVAQGSDSFSLEWTRADGSGGTQQLLESKKELNTRSFSPDGKHLAFEEREAKTGEDLWTLPLDLSDPEHPKPGKPELLLGTPANEIRAVFSPDGHWFAYSSNESGTEDVFVRPFLPGGQLDSGKWLISTRGGQFPAWSRDRKELFYKDLDDQIMVASYTATGSTFVPLKPRQWANARVSGAMDVSPDAKRFVIREFSGGDLLGQPRASVHVTFLLNFFDEVLRRIPAGK